jgi:ATPase family associated with various cellular activities (AAA)
MKQDNPILIERLRSLRVTERRLRETLVDDLRAFQKLDDCSFFTLPISSKEGISVASTCTALMALIDSNEVDELFPRKEPGSSELKESTPKLTGTSAATRQPARTAPKRSPARSSTKPKEQSQAADLRPTGMPTARNGMGATAGAQQIAPHTENHEAVAPLKELFEKVMQEKWASSDLNDLNAFTTCIVIRTAGFLVSAGILTRDEVSGLTHRHHDPPEGEKPRERNNAERELRKIEKPSLTDIIRITAEQADNSFRVERYPPKTAMAYWFVDGVTKARIEVAEQDWRRVANWSAQQFERQLSYVDSHNDALMDPPALAMAACLVSRIRKTSDTTSELSEISNSLPSRVELLHAVEQVFTKQSGSGIWHKHFPLFHFPGSGAADYCFSFEFLEAILIEFADMDILENPLVLEGIEKAVAWCRNNRFHYRKGNDTYAGWNAGGEVENLAAGMPEAWATASVHMFLAELEAAISHTLQKLILTRLRAEIPRETKLDNLIDVDLQFQGDRTSTLKTIIKEKLLPKNVDDESKIEKRAERGKESPGIFPSSLRTKPLSGARSALLFGPPGTSKTTFAEAVAEHLTWPFVIINPSDFLSKGLEQIYVRANEIFDDLMDLSGTVVLFDEMDALVQTRQSAQQESAGHKHAAPGLDVARQMLTTSMLPKLADLHKRARVMFFMATNHMQQLDPAITRPGRFDLLLCIGPPSWNYVLDGLGRVTKKDIPGRDLPGVQSRLRELAKADSTIKRLNRFTVADLKSFLHFLQDLKESKSLVEALERMTTAEFEGAVKEWTEKYITMHDESELLQEFADDFKASRVH